MTTTADLDVLVRQLSEMLAQAQELQAAPRAAVLPNGFPGPVTAGTIIESAWGNATSASFDALNKRLPICASVPGSGGTSGGGWPIQGYNFPPQPVPGRVFVWSRVRCDFNGGTGYGITLKMNGTTSAQWTFTAAELAAGQSHMVTLITQVNLAANTPCAVNVDGAGAANITTYADGTVNRMELMFIPDRL